MLLMFSLLAFIPTLVSSLSSSFNGSGAFIGVISSNNSLVIQPPHGGFVQLINCTELSAVESSLALATSGLSSALVRVSATETALSSALIRSNQTEEIVLSLLMRVAALETRTASG